MTTPIAIIVVFVVSLILLIGGARRFLLQALYGLMQSAILIYQRISGVAIPPVWMTRLATSLHNAARGTLNWITTVLSIIGWILVVLVLAIAVGIASGNTLALGAIAMFFGTLAYLLFRASWIFNKTWGATTALVLYGLAVAGLLMPATVRINPKFVVAGLLVWTMFGILWRLASQTQTRTAVWAKWTVRTAMVLVIIATATVLVATQVGWVDLRVGRTLFSNNVINDQANTENAFHKNAESAIDNTVRGIYYTLGNEVNSGAPNPDAADADLEKLEAQKAVIKKGYSVNPVPASRRQWINSSVMAYGGLFLLVILVIGHRVFAGAVSRPH